MGNTVSSKLKWSGLRCLGYIAMVNDIAEWQDTILTWLVFPSFPSNSGQLVSFSAKCIPSRSATFTYFSFVKGIVAVTEGNSILSVESQKGIKANV